MSELKIKRAKRDDCKHLMDMVRELAVFETMEDQVETSEEDLQTDGFDTDPPYFHCLIAELDDKVIGYALYFYTYSTNEGGQLLYLEDLYVREIQRGKGYGRRLFKAVVEEAKTQSSMCMQWCVLNWNQKALDFYQSLGAFDLTLTNNIHMCRFTFKGMHSVLGSKLTP